MILSRSGPRISEFTPWGLGFSLFLPGVAAMNVGSGSSIQWAVFFSLLVLVFHDKERIHSAAWIWAALASLGMAGHALAMVLSGYELNLYLKAWTFHWLGVPVVLAGALIAGTPPAWRQWECGYLAGGAVSCFWAVAQYLSINILGTIPGFLLLPLNSRSFSMRSRESVEKLVGDGRAFGFTPEPSLLFLLLLPATMLAIHRRRWGLSILLSVGLYTTNSMSILVVMPIVLLHWVWSRKLVSWRFVVFSLVSGAVGAVYLSEYVLSNFTVWKLGQTGRLLDRLTNLAGNVSLISRANSIHSAWQLILEYPLMGLGIMSDRLQAELLARSTLVEANRGINSFLFSQVAWWGLPLGAFLLLPFAAILVPWGNAERRFGIALLFGFLFPVLAINSYPNLYQYWFALGAVFPIVLLQKDRE